MKIRVAKRTEINEIMNIYKRAEKFMAETGNTTQWVGYPTEELILSDIDRGELYVCMQNNDIVGVFMFSCKEDNIYDYIEGQWINNLPYGVVHRNASSGKMKGVGRFCLEWAIEKCGNLKIDTHRNNAPMRGLLKSMDFSECGIVYISENKPRIAFQKTVE